jgi:phosphatidylinositol-3-phosphatase
MNANAVLFRFMLVLVMQQAGELAAQGALPRPDHIVIVIFENHGYNQIIGSVAAPYINALATDTLSALFTSSYGITHPSQPNYLALYSGDTQGVTDDLLPSGTPFTTPNLGRQLLDGGKSFVTYSEDLPQVGFNGELSGYYARRHNPATNWMGGGTNQVPMTVNQPYTAFPAGNFALLPTVCFVQPGVNNDMHDGTDPSRIATGDNWIANNLDGYIRWAKTTNNLFILTFDEDNDTPLNRITTIFTGKIIQHGQNSALINHYSILHTIEMMYGLPVIGDSTLNVPIRSCWKLNLQNGIPASPGITTGSIYPNPCNGYFYVRLLAYQGATAEIYNMNGGLIQVSPLVANETEIRVDGLLSGLYLLKIKSNEGVSIRKFVKK